MLKKLLTLFFIVLSVFAKAQSYTISGVIKDTADYLPSSSVMLLNVGDSTLASYARSDANGKFIFRGISKKDYIVKAMYVGYLPFEKLVKYKEDTDSDLGEIVLKQIPTELYEVVIKTARAPISVKGDTIEYDATKFKVPEGSNVEDLLRRLPGFQVDGDGNIKAQGRDVQKVLVDGKRFFGDDPKIATKNLPSVAVNKVQVFDDTSEQSKLTGVEDGKKEKTINLELKEEFKKGGFGKGTVGAGTQDRAMAKINYNKFDAKNQFAILGFGNNLSQSGLSRTDYQDFKGSQSYNWDDNADFGFGMAGGIRIIYDNGDEGDGLEIPRSWGADQGLSKNFAGGLNYNYDTKKTKFSSSYFYNNTDQSLVTNANTKYILPNLSYSLRDSSNNGNIASNHRISLRFEKELDSLDKVVINFNGKIGDRSNSSLSGTKYFNDDLENFRDKLTNNSYSANNMVLSGSAIYRHKFMKKGRNFALSGTYYKNNNDQEATQQSTFQSKTVNGQSFNVGIINDVYQNVSFLGNNENLKSSVLYVEPLSENVFLEFFYNFSLLNQTSDRDVYSLFSDLKPRVDSLSRYFDNRISYNRLGTSVRYTKKGFNMTVGLAGQQMDINGLNRADNNGVIKSEVNNKYTNLVPNWGMSMQLKNNKYLYADYDYNINAPSINDLQPFVDNSNPLYIKIGNPDLSPSQSHNMNAGFGFHNPVSFINVWSGINFGINTNQIVYNQTVSENLVTTITPENIKGGYFFNAYYNFGFPIIKTKLSSSINMSYAKYNTPLYINAILNTNDRNTYNVGLDVSLTPLDWFSLFGNIRNSFVDSKFSINERQNQKFYNLNSSVSSQIKLFKNYFVNVNYDYSQYVNKGQDFNNSLPLLNASVHRVFGKENKNEIKLSVFDALKRNVGISQMSVNNMVSNSVTQSLSRYFMLSYTYNMRGNSTQMKKNRWE